MDEELLTTEAGYDANNLERFDRERYNSMRDAEIGMEAAYNMGVETANAVDSGMSPEEISEFTQAERETYEEFAEDFEESDPQESGYAGITDEAAADSLEAAADEYFDEEKGYTGTADYTMISDEETSGS